MTATRFAGTASGNSLPSGWKDVKADYGAVGNGSTDDTTAIQNALNFVTVNGGVLYFPIGTYVVSSMLTIDNTGGWTLLGATPCMEHQMGRCRLKFTGTGAGSCLKITRSFGFKIENLAFDYTSDSFTGHLINIDGTLADVQDFEIKACGSDKTSGANSATSILRLHKAIRGKISFCHFTHAQQGIRLSDPGGSYVNVVTIENCPFDFYGDCAIFVASPDLEKVTIRDCSFEAGCIIRGAEAGTDGADNACYALTIEDCWFGDAVGATPWIKGLKSISNANPCTISGNQFFDNGGVAHMKLAGKWNVIGNAFYGSYAFDSSNSPELLVLGNWFNALTAIWSGADNGGTFLGNRGASDRFGNDLVQMPANSGSISPAANPGTGLVLAGMNANGYASGMANRGGVYYAKVPLPGSSPMLCLQAPYDGGGTLTGRLRIVAGATPDLVIEAGEGNTLGFHGASPVAQAGRAGQLTDSTGGTVTSTLAAGITDTVAKNAIASLAAKVNALETIIHNKGLSA